MEILMGIATMISGLYLNWLGMIMQTKNTISELIFKFIPCILGTTNTIIGFLIIKNTL